MPCLSPGRLLRDGLDINHCQMIMVLSPARVSLNARTIRRQYHFDCARFDRETNLIRSVYGSPGIRQEVAKSLAVPRGIMPNAGTFPSRVRMQLAASLTDPSPPPTTTRSILRRQASSIYRWISPASQVTRTSSWCSASRSVLTACLISGRPAFLPLRISKTSLTNQVPLSCAVNSATINRPTS